ncbi:MAG: hypothetical protein M0Z69_12985 [Actinomycetota bacterium]|nr:hypothetical protein [Actinomycetota bacterium]
MPRKRLRHGAMSDPTLAEAVLDRVAAVLAPHRDEGAVDAQASADDRRRGGMTAIAIDNPTADPKGVIAVEGHKGHSTTVTGVAVERPDSAGTVVRVQASQVSAIACAPGDLLRG